MQLILPGLSIIATPLGNIGDLSPRARESLAEADLILAEDTRRAARLLRELGIEGKKLTSFFEHNEEKKVAHILEFLIKGQKIALVSDAGTPVLADPGYKLVKACQKAGIKVTPIPGPSAPVAALSASGLPPIPFSFLGFLPRGQGAREKLFRNFAAVPGSLIFFERKDRIRESLEMAYSILGNREYVIARELTKTYEEFIRGSLDNYASIPDLLGEITIIIAPAEEMEKTSREEIENIARDLKIKGLPTKEAAKIIRDAYPGWKTSEVYKIINNLEEL